MASKRKKRPAKKKRKLGKLADLRPAPYNPREIDAESLEALGHSLEEFGDVSGITWNRRTGHLVTGHQRILALRKKYGPKKLEIADSVILAPDGERFPVRIVDWPKSEEKAANVAANSDLLAGRFTPGLGAVLDEIRADLPEVVQALRLSEIAVAKIDFEPQPDATVPKLDEKSKIICPECGHEFTP